MRTIRIERCRNPGPLQAAAPAGACARSWLEPLGLHRPELRAWAMYDWANSAMVAVIMTAVFPLFFENVATAAEERSKATTRFFAVIAGTIAVSAFLAPALGALSDRAGIKKRLLGICLGIGVASVAGMALLDRGQWGLAAALFFLANVAATASFVFYDALLPHVAAPSELDRVSAAGYALGYISGGILLGLYLAMIRLPGCFGLGGGSDHAPQMRLIFLITAAWWALFSIPLFLRVPEPAPDRLGQTSCNSRPFIDVLTRLAHTLRQLRQYRQAFLLLLAFLIFTDGIFTIIRVAVPVGQALIVEADPAAREAGMIAAIMLTQLIGVPCTFIFGRLAGIIGTRPSIFIGLTVYVLLALVAYFMTTVRMFFLLAGLVGLVQGGTQALSRSLFATLIPRQKSGEFFGFFGVVEKFAGIIGVMLMLLMTRITGNVRPGILAVASLFVIGAVLLGLVDIERGQQIARHMEDQPDPG